jgi:hypothetical protein
MNNNNANVKIPSRELKRFLPYYTLIDDCLGGEIAIKEKRELYLPIPNEDAVNSSVRYDSYLTRAVVFNVAYKTLAGITGHVYLKDVNYKLPTLLGIFKKDCTGEGVSLPQLSKRAMQQGMAKGMAGIFVDFPYTENAITADDITSGKIQPIFRLYEAQEILDIRVRSENGKVFMSKVRLKEFYREDEDEYLDILKYRYRILRLQKNELTGNNEFTVETIEDYNLESEGIVTPLKSDGTPFDFIPFFPIGSENNDSNRDHPPMYDLCSVMIGHYRNSADYEESVFVNGQPMLVYSGITEQWNTDVLGGKIMFGSQGSLPLPEGGDAKILQVQPNTLAFEAMTHKEDQMLALGAKLVQQSVSNRKTATEAGNEAASEISILINVAKNTSDAFTAALQCACLYVGADETEVEFELQADSTLVKLDPQKLLALVKSWQDGAISRTELRYNLRNEGIAHGDEDAAIAEIEKEQKDKQDLQDKQMMAKQKQTTGVTNA